MKTLAAILLLLSVPAHAAPQGSEERALEARVAADRSRIDAWRQFQKALTGELERLSLRAESSPLSQPELKRLGELWSGIADLQLALDVVDHRWRETEMMRGAIAARSMATAYEAWIARTTGALAVIEATRGREALRELLNEPLPQLGLPAGTLTRMQQMIETAATSTQFLAFQNLYQQAVQEGRIPPSPTIDEDATRLNEWLRARGVQESARNASLLLTQDVSRASSLLAAAPSPWFGEAHRTRRSRPLITTVRAERIQQVLQPGDIVLFRDEWEPGGAGLSSYWSSAGVWTGSPAERRYHFRDPATLAAFRSEGFEDLDGLIRNRTPHAYGASLNHGGQPATLITTTPFGVAFERSSALQADSVAVLRLRRSAHDRAMIVLRSFELIGSPFDPTGDVHEQTAVGSAELVLRALGDDAPRLGKSRIAVDDLVEWFDRVAGEENPTWELLLYVEGDESSRNVRASDAATFRTTWSRPAWRTWINAAALRQRLHVNR